MADEKQQPKQPKKIELFMLDPNNTNPEDLAKAEEGMPTLSKSILNVLDGGSTKSIERLAFEQDPTRITDYASLYTPKLTLIPDFLLKRMAIQDSLVAAVVNTRSNHVSAFGRVQEDRFSSGFKIEPRPGVMDGTTEEQAKALKDRIDHVAKIITSCGFTKGWEDDDHMNIAQYLKQITRDGVTVGRFSTEIIYAQDMTGEKRFHSFRPVDAATIYKAKPHSSQAESVRREAIHLLETIKNKRLEPERFRKDEYSWVQVIDGKPVQAFTSKELLVHNLYPVTDVQMNGYPVTPLDTVISEVTTHINITQHNKLYFQNGRAAKGMLIIKSADVDASVVNAVRQQFQASINSVSNSFRLPVFGITPEDDIAWSPIESQGGRDMEFQYLSDMNARTIMAAFQMSPEELPGYQHLSRGSNSQALSESNNEFKLVAARDVGIRPLLAAIEDFFNEKLIPLIDPEVARLCYLKFKGLDADTPEKETARLQQSGTLYMNMNDIMEKVEKDPFDKEVGGEFPLNPSFQAAFEKYMTFGEIKEHFFGHKGASKDPSLAFYQNPMWFQWQQFQMQMQQMQMQQQQMEMQAQAQQQGAAAGGPPPQDGGDGGGQPQPEGPPEEGGEDLGSSIDQLATMLSKSEGSRLSPSGKKLLAQHRLTVKHLMDKWEDESKEALASIVAEVKKHV